MTLDRRLHPFREDLAAESLREKVSATAFTQGTLKSVRASLVPLHRAPDRTSLMDTQILMGDSFTVYEEKNGWVWGQAGSDGYVGYIPADTLGPWNGEPTHRVNVLRTFYYTEPDIKAAVLGFLTMNAGVQIKQFEGSFAQTSQGYWIYAQHLSPWHKPLSDDFVSIAEQYIKTPYQWGGKSSIGIDCSGLIQMALAAIGIFAPRDTDMQEKDLGHIIEWNSDLSGLQRGDLLFWKGHVAVMTSPTTMLHATARHMLTYTEPVVQAEERIRVRKGIPLSCIKRLDITHKTAAP